MIKQLNEYKVQLTLPVVWGDMDSFHHVNNLVYLRHFESIRMLFMEKCDYSMLLHSHNVGPVLKSTDCSYKLPLTFPDTVVAAVRVTAVQSDRFHMKHVVFSKQYEKVAAEGNSTMVFFDFSQGQKTSIPQILLDKMIEIQPTIRGLVPDPTSQI